MGDKTKQKGAKAGKKTSSKSSRKIEGKSKARYAVDIFSETAMENAYYICHNIQDVLRCRGFPWPNAQKKKKKGKKK